MKRIFALALSAVLLVGVCAACGSEKEQEVPINEYTTEGPTEALSGVPEGYIAFGTIDEANVVTPSGLTYLLSSLDETVAVDEKSKVEANISEIDGTVASVTVDGKSIPVYIEELNGENVIYGPQGDSADDPNTIDMTGAGNLATAAGVKTTKRSTTTAKAKTSKKTTKNNTPIATAAAVKTTKKVTTTTDGYQAAKQQIQNNPNMSAKEKQEALKLLSYKMDSNGIFYVEHEPWQKQFGFNQIYDSAAPLIQLVYGTVRVKFTYGYVYKLYTEGAKKGQVMYDADKKPIYETDASGNPIEKDWMIQMWKGRYGLVMLGAEIGVYTKPRTQSAEHYNSAVAEEELIMAMDVYQHNFKTNKTTYLFTRGPESAWWLTGFVPGAFYEYNKKSEVILVANVQFPDEAIASLFANGLQKAGFSQGSPGRDNPETYRVGGNSVKFSWQYIDQDA